MQPDTSTIFPPGCSVTQKENHTAEIPVRILSWDVGIAGDGKTAEQFLREHGCSHHVLTHLKRTENGICRNGVWTYANQRLCAGDRLTIAITEPEPSDRILPVPLPLTVVYEDEDLLVADKPCGMPVHPSMGNYDNTLANAVMYHCQDRPFVFRCINRLDRDTSGLLVIAKNMYSGAVLADSLLKRQIHREYLAIAEGILPVSQTIDVPIARKPGSALMRCVDRKHGERAVTHVCRLARFERKKNCRSDALPPYLSLASVRLETGRTHQIRVHLAYTGHPLPGDFLYNPPSGSEIPDILPGFSGNTVPRTGSCAADSPAFTQNPDFFRSGSGFMSSRSVGGAPEKPSLAQNPELLQSGSGTALPLSDNSAADNPAFAQDPDFLRSGSGFMSPRSDDCPPGAPASAMIRRQALHSFRLAFPHPVTGQPLSFESDLPGDMRRLLAAYDRLPDE